MINWFNFWSWNRASKKLKKYKNIQEGLIIKVDKDVNSDINKAVEKLEKWLKKEKCWFPVKITVHVKKDNYIKDRKGRDCVMTSFFPYDFKEKFDIKIATGDYKKLLKEKGNKDDVLADYIYEIILGLTYYYQWINGFHHPQFLKYLNAKIYASYIFDDYVSDNKTAL